jgi:hypothetical protein
MRSYRLLDQLASYGNTGQNYVTSDNKVEKLTHMVSCRCLFLWMKGSLDSKEGSKPSGWHRKRDG